MMQGPRAPFGGGMPPNAFRTPMPPRPPMGPIPPMAGGGLRGAGGLGQARQGGGGLLSRLLGRGNPATGMGSGIAQASRAAGATGAAGTTGGGGGILRALSNPGAVTGFLQNTQKVLTTAQQIGPMVQQYGPIVKNLPAMWKLYRGLKNTGDSDDSNESKDKVQEIEESEKAKKTGKKTKKKEITVEEHESSSESTIEKDNGIPKPKLYV
ncbi:YqfQ family protein [Bacillus sp. S/N-304-OC-R1]|uniref:YqfQ family protein n=1 Tax=Bacillus sp. S/N-304-OC-R1 TaxID=2758034 RepID=UPI001C8DF601|nr:YqfQ family protein [Bacillus sp. S/N-304-OC-R1]MBY0122361.1 hypothetical protein [Bacillus sp. S/N-304-OC-R1]